MSLADDLHLAWEDSTHDGEGSNCGCHTCVTFRRALALVEAVEQMPGEVSGDVPRPVWEWAARLRELCK